MSSIQSPMTAARVEVFYLEKLEAVFRQAAALVERHLQVIAPMTDDLPAPGALIYPPSAASVP
jgi:hypothetical protein